MRRISGFLVAVALVVALAGFTSHPAVAPASSQVQGRTTVACSQVGTKHHTKARFVLHAGLAFGAFYYFLYKPFKAGKFKSGAPGRIKAMALGGAAALFAYHELKVAKGFAEADKTLCKLVAPIDKLTASLLGLGAGLKKGQLNEAGINGAAQNVSSLKGSASSLGSPITEHVPPSLGSS